MKTIAYVCSLGLLMLGLGAGNAVGQVAQAGPKKPVPVKTSPKKKPNPPKELIQFGTKIGSFPKCVNDEMSRLDFTFGTNPPGNEVKVKFGYPLKTSKPGALPAYASYKGTNLTCYYRVVAWGEAYHDDPPHDIVSKTTPYSENAYNFDFPVNYREYVGTLTISGQGYCDIDSPVDTVDWVGCGTKASIDRVCQVQEGVALEGKYLDYFKASFSTQYTYSETIHSEFPMQPNRDLKITVHNQYAELTGTKYLAKYRDVTLGISGWNYGLWVPYQITTVESAGSIHLSPGVVLWRKCCQ